MAFKMSYSFEGNYRSRPEQNLSGASKKQTRDVILQRAHEERQKRQADRLKLKSTEIIQSYTRSYLERKRIKEEQRLLFDQNEDSGNLHTLMVKLLFFYDPSQDANRVCRTCERLLSQQNIVLGTMVQDTSYSWLVKRLLVICLRSMTYPPCTSIVVNCLDVFTHNSNVLSYLISKGYYKELRNYLDCPREYVDTILNLINRPFEYMRNLNTQNEILSEFTEHFLTPAITPPIKNTLIPFLNSTGKFPHAELVGFLSQEGYAGQNNLLYCVLALEPADFVQTKESIKVLSALSTNLHELVSEIMYVSDDDSDTEEMEVSDGNVKLQDYQALFNQEDRVKRILNFFSKNEDDEDVLMSLTQLCHSLLLIYTVSIRKFMLLYMLALKGTFLLKLWYSIKYRQSVILQSVTLAANSWKACQTPISVFCDMFTFYTETLTDAETSDTSGTFTTAELCSMSELLKSVALNLIELAFPMCRSTNTVKVSSEMLHLYRSSLDAVKKLHMLDLRRNFCELDFWTRKKIHVSQDLTKKNYLSKTIRPFYGLVPETEDDEHLPPLSTIEQRSLAILKELPFLIEFNQRVLTLRQMCYYSFGNTETRFRNEFFNDNVITVRRAYLYEDAFDKLSQRNESDLRHKLRIQFINNAGLEEAGIDGGGIFKEFINEVLKTAFDPNRGFFLLTADNMLYPNPQVHLIHENYPEHYYFIGRLVGKAIFENILVDLPLAEFFLAKLLVDRASAHYLKSLDPVLYRNLLYLRDYKGDVQDLGLDFTLVNNDLGETRVIELIPNGVNIPVTNYNRLEYIHKLADLKLNTQIKRQCSAFRDGLDSVVPLLWLKLFNHNELQVIIAGDTQEMDIEDLRTYTAYGGEYTPEHPTIISFWKILRSFTDTQKKMLLKFVTSCSRPPLLGFKELNPSFCIQSSGSEDRMPTASTCLNLLKLPVIRDEETLRRKLLSAIEQQAGFELS